jgi:hypothetical protein
MFSLWLATGFVWEIIPAGANDLSAKVAAFRRGLDVNALDKSGDAAQAVLFDLRLANELYSTLLSPVEALIKDKPSLLVVPSGALTALPFHLPVTEKSALAVPQNFDGYRDAAWLIKRQAVGVLPSVAGLKVLRAFATKDRAVKPMIGFGNPVFNPSMDTGNAPRAAGIKVVAQNCVASLALQALVLADPHPLSASCAGRRQPQHAKCRA